VICRFKKTFLKDLAELPATYRRKIERLVFEEFPKKSGLLDKLDIRKIQGYENYYRIRIGEYRIGCETSRFIFLQNEWSESNDM
jgi:mRNA interferase RelE/StbE